MTDSMNRGTQENRAVETASLLTDWWNSLCADVLDIADQRRRDLVERLGIYVDELVGVAERLETIAPRAGAAVHALGAEVGSLTEQIHTGDWRTAVQVVRRTVAANPLYALAGAVCGGALVSLADRYREPHRPTERGHAAPTDRPTEH
jgi:hypothetical protein